MTYFLLGWLLYILVMLLVFVWTFYEPGWPDGFYPHPDKDCLVNEKGEEIHW